MSWNVELDADVQLYLVSGVATGGGTTVLTVAGPEPVKVLSITVFNRHASSASTIVAQVTRGATTYNVHGSTAASGLVAGTGECWNEDHIGYLELEPADVLKLVAGTAAAIDAVVAVHKLAKHGRGDRRAGHYDRRQDRD